MANPEQALELLRTRGREAWPLIKLDDPALQSLVNSHVKLLNRLRLKTPPRKAGRPKKIDSRPLGGRYAAPEKKPCGCGGGLLPHQTREARSKHGYWMHALYGAKSRWNRLRNNPEARKQATEAARAALRAKREAIWLKDVNPRTLSVLGKDAVIRQINQHRQPSHRIKI